MHRKAFIFVFGLLIAASALAQPITVTGRVTDAETEDGITFANIFVKGIDTAIVTDADGYYRVRVSSATSYMAAGCIGYKRSVMPLKKATAVQVVNFELDKADTTLLQKKLMTKSENAALAIVQKVIAGKAVHNKKSLDSYGYEAYTKMEVNLIDLTERFKKRKIFAPFNFIFDNIDTVSEVKPFLPFFLTETVSDYYYQKHPVLSREIIKASKISGLDDVGISQFLGSSTVQAEVNSDFVLLINSQYLSPLSSLAPIVYRYYLEDSQVIDHYKCYRIRFAPKSLKLAKLEGEMWIVDSLYTLKRIRLRTQTAAGISPVRNISLYNEFVPVGNGVWMLKRDKLTINGIKFNNTPELVLRKSTTYSKFVINSKRIKLDSIFKTIEADIVIKDSASNKSKAYWQKIRKTAGTQSYEDRTYRMIDTLGSLRVTRRYLSILESVFTGYADIGPVSIGNIYSFLGHDKITGWTFKYGMRTSYKLSKIVRVGGYVAYGERDHIVRYGAEGLWLIRKDPRLTLSGSYHYDLVPSRDYNSFYSTSDFFTSSGLRRWEAGRFIPLKELEIREFRMNFMHEFKFGYSYNVGILNQNLKPVGDFNFSYLTAPENRSPGTTITSAKISEFSLTQRFAWHERFLNSRFTHVGFGSKYPVVTFQIAIGAKNILGSQFDYQKFAITVDDTRFIGLFGRLSYNVQVGKIYGVMPYLFLQVPNSSETYIAAWPIFNTLNKYQFAADRYVQAMVEHHLDGLIFDRIPGLKKLKFREVWGVHMWWGDMTQKNQTANYANLSSDAQNVGLVKVGVADRVPFIEMNAGIENIVSFFRIDAVWKMNYFDPRGTRYSFRYGNCGVRLSFTYPF